MLQGKTVSERPSLSNWTTRLPRFISWRICASSRAPYRVLANPNIGSDSRFDFSRLSATAFVDVRHASAARK
jgi:hypothetical protein